MKTQYIKKYPDEAAAQLIPHLSEGIYTTFPKAVKELIINSFDADASRVDIDISQDFTAITILDDGTGINADKFHSEFIRVAGSKKRVGKANRKYPRPMIGRFGVGFLAVARICNTARIYSKVSGDEKVIVREIPLSHLFEEGNQLSNLKDQYYYHELPDLKGDKSKSFTKIELLDIRDDIKSELKNNSASVSDWSDLDDLSGIEKFKTELGLLLPIEYGEHFPVYRKETDETRRIKAELASFHFKVYINKAELRRQVSLGHRPAKNSKWNYDVAAVADNEIDIIPLQSPPGARIQFHGYIYNQSKQILPAYLRGIIIRINNIGIKGYSRSIYEFSKNIGPILSAISGEVFLNSDFEEVLTLDKDGFKEDHPLFKELIKYIHATIDDVASKSRKRSAGKSATKENKQTKVKDLNTNTEGIKKAEKILGKKQLASQYFPNPDITINTSLRQLRARIGALVGQTLSREEASYLIEAITCFESECYRGAVLMGWNTGMFRIHRKLEKDIGLAAVDAKITQMRSDSHVPRYIRERLSPCRSQEELKLYSEQILCHVIEKLGLFDSTNAQLFAKALIIIRNNCAHPTGYSASDGDAIVIIQSILDKVLNMRQFQIQNP